MIFEVKDAISGIMILANDHYTAKAYDCMELTDLATDGVIPAGTLIPANDATAEGVLLTDVNIAENPNGAIVTHGAVVVAKLPETPSDAAISALTGVQFIEY
ncbi:MAG: hypothetical protein LIO74_10995 [Ruminococcus sp.]|nr:hypothetical protein [Ruminococcus sp.]